MFKVVVGARNRIPIPIPYSKYIPESIPIHDSIPKPLFGADAEPGIRFNSRIVIGSGIGFGSGK